MRGDSRVDRLHVVVMAGGAGTRFWPRSRASSPKQFLTLGGERSLLAETVARCEGLCPSENIWVSTRRDLSKQVLEQLPALGTARLITEPEGRDTAPALVLAAARVARVDPEAWLLVLPADHRISDVDAFRENVIRGVEALAAKDGLLTFGIRPRYPATGYGYIRVRPDASRRLGNLVVHAAAEFREKPPLETAEDYLARGDYLWNAGIFLWRLPTFRRALELHAPDLAVGWSALGNGTPGSDPGVDSDADRVFRTLRRISIDYAVFETAANVFVAEATFPWDDLGSWRSVEAYLDADPDGNITEGLTELLESRNNTVFASDERVIAMLGVEGLVVIDTPDALLICPRDRVEQVKKLVDQLRANGREGVL